MSYPPQGNYGPPGQDPYGQQPGFGQQPPADPYGQPQVDPYTPTGDVYAQQAGFGQAPNGAADPYHQQANYPPAGQPPYDAQAPMGMPPQQRNGNAGIIAAIVGGAAVVVLAVALVVLLGGDDGDDSAGGDGTSQDGGDGGTGVDDGGGDDGGGGAGGESPSQVVENMLNAMYSGDTDTAWTYVCGDASSYLTDDFESGTEEMSSYGDITFTTSNEVIEGDTAEVDVSMSMPDYGLEDQPVATFILNTEGGVWKVCDARTSS